MINISEHSNRVLNIVKAKYGLKDKSQAIDMVVQSYEDELLEPELKPEFVAKLEQIEKGPHKRFKSVAELRKAIENV